MLNKLITLVLVSMMAGCMFMHPDYLQVINADELNQLLKNHDILLVDVHSPEQKHIKGTDFFVPYNEIEKHKDKFPTDKTTPIYLYCEAGPMGNAAARTLYELGYQNLTNLEGGANAWRKHGFEFE